MGAIHADHGRIDGAIVVIGFGSIGRGGFCVHLSVDTSSLELMRLARELGALYIDTVVEAWAGL
jgi:homospermidine synthase